MKLAQSLIKGFYRTKFKTMGRVSPQKAAEAAFRLFCTPYSGKPKREMPAIFHQAKKVSVQVDELTINGFEWPSHKNELPTINSPLKTILICHGFDSYSYRFEQYIPEFLKENCRVLAFDAPAHGISDGKRFTVLLYKKMLLEVEKQFGPFYGIMAHSLACLAVTLAMEEWQQPQVKLALIAPATETSRAINQFFTMFPVDPKTYHSFIQLLENLGGKPVSWYSMTRTTQVLPNPVLWLHDTEDRVCPFEDTLPIRELKLPNVHFVETTGLGHSKIYRAIDIQKRIVNFLLH
jgi:alpha-beta hydrolase superfamily lysophospholipase